MRFLIMFTCFLLHVKSFTQGNEESDRHIPRWSIELKAGLQGNFFVSGDSYGSGGTPLPGYYKILKKNFVGSMFGADLIYNINKMSRLSLGFTQAENRAQVNFLGVNNDFYIGDWNISHRNYVFQAFYERNWSKKVNWFRYHMGVFYLRSSQQEIEIGDFPNPQRFVSFEERNFKNSSLEEAGFLAGIQIAKRIDTHFEIGLRSGIYFLASTGTFEMVTLTPTLAYTFSKSNRSNRPRL